MKLKFQLQVETFFTFLFLLNAKKILFLIYQS